MVTVQEEMVTRYAELSLRFPIDSPHKYNRDGRRLYLVKEPLADAASYGNGTYIHWYHLTLRLPTRKIRTLNYKCRQDDYLRCSDLRAEYVTRCVYFDFSMACAEFDEARQKKMEQPQWSAWLEAHHARWSNRQPTSITDHIPTI